MKGDIIVRCTTIEEALAVSRAANHYISEESCKPRFAEVCKQCGHLDFVFEESTMYAPRWGDYPELIRMKVTPPGLPIVSGWEFLGELQEVFRSDISLESLLAGKVGVS